MKKLLLPIFALCLMAFSGTAQTDTLFQEDFDGGIPDTWTISPGNPEGAVWQWSPDGAADVATVDGETVEALFWGTGTIESPTASNGAAMYNSDVYDGGGTGVGQGPFPGTHSGSLTSPAFSCEGFDTLYLAFHQFARANANTVSTILEVSVDTGNTWVALPINPEVVGNGGTARTDLELVDISEVAGDEPHVQIRFTWNGRYYYWLIDDIQVITPMDQELEMGDFFYPPASFSTPVSQVAADTFGFEVDITNFGKEIATNVVVKASILERITDTQTALLWEDSLVIAEFPPFYQDSTIQLPNQYVPDLPLGEYVVRYDVYSQDTDDFNPRNNAQQDDFRVSSELFAKEPALESGTRPGTQSDFQMGNFYQISPIATEQFVTNEVSFGGFKNAADGPMGGENTTIFLYKVSDAIDANFDNFDTSIETEDLEQIGFGFHTFEDNEEGELITIPLTDLDGNPIPLEPGGRYFVVTEWANESTDVFSGTNDDFMYFQISTVVRTSEWFLGGFGPETTSVTRMSIALASTNDDIELPEAAMNIFPNPVAVNDQLNVNFDLEGNSPAMLVVADLNGRVIQLFEYEQGLTNETVQIPTGKMATGTYLVRLSTEQGTKTMKFNVVR
ncbi:MAG: T9SS type A sorting domain-containing protein [Phaeodactylibacter sp.]|uniref:T9SS type A sorting domain-containing protein n=1 Tax=Phaeodactylibacter sp. TaxID=1940289 RepID=UPI0032EC39D0